MKSNVPDSFLEKLFDLKVLKKSITAFKDRNTSHHACSGLAKCIASGFYVVYIPFIQGTVGSLWIPLLYLLIPGTWLLHFQERISFAILVISVVLYFTGVWASSECEMVWGRDPGRVVIDEIAGMFVTLLFVPITTVTVWLGFFLFRIFDVVKPPPVRWSEQFPRGWGIMSDDVLAGIYANIVLRIVLFVYTYVSV